jgi:hypothetical protein
VISWKTTVSGVLTLALLLSGATAVALADFSYNLSVDTSSLTGSTGYLDIQFNPTTTSTYPSNGGTGVVTATVQTQTGNDALLGPTYFSQGNVTGPGATNPPTGLPLTFMADNSSSGPLQNEFAQAVTYGSNLALSVNITTPDAISPASLLVTLYDSNFNNLLAISPANNSTIEVDLVPNPGGTSPGVNLQTAPEASVVPLVAIPEPPLGMLLAQALVCLGMYGIYRRNRLPQAG